MKRYHLLLGVSVLFAFILLVPEVSFGQKVNGTKKNEKPPVKKEVAKPENKIPSAQLLEIIGEALKKQEALKSKSGSDTKNEKQDRNEGKIVYEIDGLLIDETLTKVGRDFYDVFYSNWEAPGQVSNFSINIKERPLRGRGFQIVILVNDTEVIEENLQPRVDMIEAAALNAVAEIRSYLLNFANLKEQIEAEDQKGTGLF